MKALIIILISIFLSGGDTNLNHRWRPTYGERSDILKYKDIDVQTRWFVEDMREWLSCPGEDKEMYLFGSRSKDNWWFSSDFDIGIVEDVTPEIIETLNRCKRKFKIPENVSIEIRKVNPMTDHKLVRIENTTY